MFSTKDTFHVEKDERKCFLPDKDERITNKNRNILVQKHIRTFREKF